MDRWRADLRREEWPGGAAFNGIMKTKICTKCDKKKALKDYYNYGNVCKSCIIEKVSIWQKNNKKKVNMRSKRYREKYPEKNRKRCNEYAKRHREERNEYQRKKRKLNLKKYQNLSKKYNLRRRNCEEYDYYIINRICYSSILTYKDIPQELIEAKRAIIKLHRLIKETENGQTRNKGTCEKNRRRVG